jgi:hypothetical protein
VFSWTHVEYPCHNSTIDYNVVFTNEKENKIKCRKPLLKYLDPFPSEENCDPSIPKKYPTP